MHKWFLLSLIFLFGCTSLPHGGPVERFGKRQCGKVIDEITVRMDSLESLARSGGSKVALYQEVQSVRGDISVAMGKCNADAEARSRLEVLESRIDRIEQDFVLGPGGPG